MNTLDRMPSLADEPAVPAQTRPRPGTVHRLGAYTTVRMITHGPAPTTVRVDGEIDLACADEFADLLCAALDAHPHGIELDLTSVRFFDCRGLRALLIAQAAARAGGRHFALGPHSPAVARLLELTGGWASLTVPR